MSLSLGMVLLTLLTVLILIPPDFPLGVKAVVMLVTLAAISLVAVTVGLLANLAMMRSAHTRRLEQQATLRAYNRIRSEIEWQEKLALMPRPRRHTPRQPGPARIIPLYPSPTGNPPSKEHIS